MSFKDAIVSAFSNYAVFSGRARRSEFWYFYLFRILIQAGIILISELIGGDRLKLVLDTLILLVLFVPELALGWRRMHDIGKSGAYVLFALLPVVGWILLIVWLCQDSQPGGNQYGPNPKE